MKVILASTGKLDHPTYEVDGVCVEPLQSRFLEKYKEGFARWAGLDIFYYMLPVAWAAWAQAQENFDSDVVETTDWALLFAPWVASPKKAPFVISLHGSCGQVDWHSHTGGERSLGGDLVRMAEVVALRGADAIHANSRMNAGFWQARTGCEVTVIPPGGGGESLNRNLTTEDTEVTEIQLVQKEGCTWASHAGDAFSNPSTSKLLRDSENTSPNRSAVGPANSEDLKLNSYKLKTPPQVLKGLVVGRLQNWKGAEMLCKALRLAPETEIEWVGGDTDWGASGMKASEYLAANYPDVFGKKLHWIGQLDKEQVAEKMRSAGFLVVPSVWDVFNLTVAEGMEAGLPVICSRAAGAEMLIKHGLSGFLFDPAKPEELADFFKFLAGMSVADRNEMGRNSQEAIKTLLDEDKILNLLEQSYGDAIKKGASTSKDDWLASLLSPGPKHTASPKLNLAQRAIRKAGRILSDV